ncbi:LysR family transcriptional regulator [Klebsiella quasipneumoniae]|uniref:LysR family transcriptional regulator n=1 Tax=Klebsiella quasipneumoniae TaxID=1463165 RepID=UPI002205AF84|nr:LysR family transcriptional regulator [Klebsiella quasipneumoniae]BDO02402.1 LysR family transcriptional regulator [Klebsiella quasipneumoniae subsp. quasipneumoniae]
MLANLEVKWLYDVIALEESRSFTLAAKARNISQSSFSRRIQSLEASLGFSIFDRSANPLQLTNRGKIFVGYARNMLDDMDFQISRIKGLNNTTQKIRIDAAPSLSVLLLPEIIVSFTYRRAAADEIRSRQLYGAPGEPGHRPHAGDHFLPHLCLFHERAAHHKIFDSYLHLVSPCDEHGRPLFHLHRGVLPLMKYANDSYMGRQVNQVIDRTPEITFSLTFVSSMSELLKRMILNGDGVGWLPQYSIQRELDEGRLTILDESLSLPIGAWLYRSGSRLNQAAERFWQHIKTRNQPRD